jgi:hypothetical protein
MGVSRCNTFRFYQALLHSKVHNAKFSAQRHFVSNKTSMALTIVPLKTEETGRLAQRGLNTAPDVRLSDLAPKVLRKYLTELVIPTFSRGFASRLWISKPL